MLLPRTANARTDMTLDKSRTTCLVSPLGCIGLMYGCMVCLAIAPLGIIHQHTARHRTCSCCRGSQAPPSSALRQVHGCFFPSPDHSAYLPASNGHRARRPHLSTIAVTISRPPRYETSAAHSPLGESAARCYVLADCWSPRACVLLADPRRQARSLDLQRQEKANKKCHCNLPRRSNDATSASRRTACCPSASFV